MNKKTLGILVALVLLVAVLVGVFFITRPETNTDMKSFTVEIVHKDGSTKTLQLKSDEEYLGTYLQAEGIIAGEEGAYGLYIKEVDGEKAVFETDGAYWGFYVDGQYAMQGIDLTPIESGKVYKLAYTIDNQ